MVLSSIWYLLRQVATDHPPYRCRDQASQPPRVTSLKHAEHHHIHEETEKQFPPSQSKHFAQCMHKRAPSSLYHRSRSPAMVLFVVRHNCPAALHTEKHRATPRHTDKDHVSCFIALLSAFGGVMIQCRTGQIPTTGHFASLVVRRKPSTINHYPPLTTAITIPTDPPIDGVSSPSCFFRQTDQKPPPTE